MGRLEKETAERGSRPPFIGGRVICRRQWMEEGQKKKGLKALSRRWQENGVRGGREEELVRDNPTEVVAGRRRDPTGRMAVV
ncbi:hypothetical protein CDL15_Pgr014491 [Punica granatum]|nr:hypothetical protein CDL15_Pgr014491 [Punica granatum]